MRLLRPNWAGVVWVNLCVLGAYASSCAVTGENAVTRHQIKPVTLTIQGRVVDAQSKLPLAEFDVILLRTQFGSEDYQSFGPKTQTDEQGQFRFEAELDAEAYLYLLAVQDPAHAYASDTNTEIYATRDGTSDVGEISLQAANQDLRGTIRGHVYAAVGGAVGAPALGSALVSVIDSESGEALTESVKTESDGSFELTNTPFRDITLKVTAPTPDDAAGDSTQQKASYRLIDAISRRMNLARALPEHADAGSPMLDVGRFFLPATQRSMLDGKGSDQFLTIVLSWDPGPALDCGAAPQSAHDLNGRLYLPGADCDVNHLGGEELSLASGAALDPGGMGSGTCFWPPFLGGDDVPTVGDDAPEASDTEYRALLSEEHSLFQQRSADEIEPADCPDLTALGAAPCGRALAADTGSETCALAAVANVSTDGNEPEVFTLFRNHVTRSWPEDLGYYYELDVTGEGELSRRYPTGIAAFTVVGEDGALVTSHPVVEVYDAGEFVARYELSALEQSAATRWTPFLIEMGSREPDPSTPKDLYFRVVSYDQVAVSINSPPYFYQDVSVDHARLDDGDERVALTGATSAVALTGTRLSVLGQTRIDGAQRPAEFRFDEASGWTASPLAAESNAGVVVEKNGAVLAALGPSVYLDGEELEPADSELAGICGGWVYDVAAIPDDPNATFLVATASGLAYLEGPRVSDAELQDPACTLLPEAEDAPPPPPAGAPPPDFDAGVDLQASSLAPTAPITKLAWLANRSVFVAAAGDSLYNVHVNGGSEPTLVWPKNEFDWQELTDVVQINTLLVLGDEQLQDVFVGTERGVIVVRGGPGLGSETRLADCEGVSDEDGRPPPSETSVLALAQFGSRLYVGTDSGLAVSSTTDESAAEVAADDKATKKSGEPSVEPESKDTEVAICVRWLPTRVKGQLDSPTELPVFPPGLTVTALVATDERLVVLTRDKGLFFLEGDAP